jgi:hypothetical protein
MTGQLNLMQKSLKGLVEKRSLGRPTTLKYLADEFDNITIIKLPLYSPELNTNRVSVAMAASKWIS